MNKDRKRVLILLNASAGTGKAASKVLEIARRFAMEGYEPVLYPVIPGTELISERILSEYDKDVDIVLCSGGDGTLNHVMQGIMSMEEPPVIAYLPAGSTNDFAASLGIPTEFGAALDVAVGGNVFRYDVGKLNDKYFNYVAAFGAFSEVSYATDQQLKNVLGHAAYIVSAVAELRHNIGYSCHMRIETKDECIEDDYIFGAVCNSVSIGGFRIFNNADIALDDGRMELLLIKAPKTPADVQGLLTALSTGTLEHHCISLAQITEATLYTDVDTAWTIDGEFGGSFETAVIKIKKQAVAIRSGYKNIGVKR